MSRFLLLGLALVAVAGVYKVEACTYLGQQHAMGDVWMAADGCNKCVCGIVGSICTKAMCTNTPPKPTTTISTPESSPVCVVIGTDGTALTYKDGENFPSPDGCNKCLCRNGNALCTLMACMKKQECTDASSGKTYAVGDKFMSTDGCNTCQCFDGGISCTEMMCFKNTSPATTTAASTTTPSPQQKVCTDASGNIYKEGEQYKADDGCNTCTCMDGIGACTEMACMKVDQCFDRFTLTLYNSGDTFTAPDGCNRCRCASGVITCTKAVC